MLSPSLTLNVSRAPLCSANTVVSVASNVPVASYAFSFPPQATIISAVPVSANIFLILIPILIVRGKFVVVDVLQHFYLMHRLLHTGSILLIDFAQ